MMEFTNQQQYAIDIRDKNVLVSASAGSGKTRVLVERVLVRLLMGDNIDDFLIVTFTEAAAEEMKGRLEKEIKDRILILEGAQRNHLIKQLQLIKIANISTIDSFALRLIEKYYYIINLDPQFRIVDNVERKMLMKRVLENVLEQNYNNEDNGDFLDLINQFMDNSGKDGLLQDAVFKLFNFAISLPNTDEWLNKLSCVYELDSNIFESKFYIEMFFPELRSKLNNLHKQYRKIIMCIPNSNDEVTNNRRQDLVEEDKYIQQMLDMLTEKVDWKVLRQKIFQFKSNSWNIKGRTTRTLEPDLKQFWDKISENRKELHKSIYKLAKQFFSLDEIGIKLAINGAKKTLETLVNITNQFRQAYLSNKIQRKAFDFNDLEHFALEIVKKPEISNKLKECYTEIMIDEYQDISDLQEEIIRFLARNNNVFQVGDIKQSIYRFRQSDPQLFFKKAEIYERENDYNEVINLVENFRSQPNVINFINYIFQQLMSFDLGGVDYVDSSKLVAGAKYYPDDLSKNVEFMIYFDENQKEDIEQIDNNINLNSIIGQIKMIGQKIKTLIDNKFKIYDRNVQVARPIKYCDIAILVSSRVQNDQIVEIFKEMELPLVVKDSGNYFQTMEVSIMINLLKVIDNPHQDISLVAILRSPIYQLGENSLALIRAQNLNSDFYTAMLDFCKKSLVDLNKYDKNLILTTQKVVNKFLIDLKNFKNISVKNKLVDLIWEIYKTTDWLDFVGGLSGGEQRQANLHALYDLAAKYQKNNFMGLYQFNYYIEQLQKNEIDDIGEVDVNGSGDAIQLMTIHGSKGLEFPVVFLLNMTKKFNIQDQVGQLIIDRQKGVGLQYIDYVHSLKLITPQYEIIRSSLLKANFSEQLRLLYVALTRAEQQIFIVGSYKTPDFLIRKWQQSQIMDTSNAMISLDARLQGNSFMDLIGMAISRHPDFKKTLNILFEKYDVKMEQTSFLKPDKNFNFSFTFMNRNELIQQVLKSNQKSNLINEINSKIEIDSQEIDSQMDDLQKNLNYQYKYRDAVHTTAYQSVSEIKRLFEDPDIYDGRNLGDKRLINGFETGLRFVNDELSEPNFVSEMKPEFAGNARGIAAHLILQKINLTDGMPTVKKIKKLIYKLVQEKLIASSLEFLLPVQSMSNFFNYTELGNQLIINSEFVEREIPFSMLIDAKQLYHDFNDKEYVLVHGIIDGFVFVNDEIWLFDYKTDYISLKENEYEILKKRYSGQINLYAQALMAMGYGNIRKFIVALNTYKVYEL